MATTTDFLPSREADLLAWSANFAAKIGADPTVYGLTLEQASTYQSLHNAFAAAYDVTRNPSTRTPTSIVVKRDAKAALKRDARSLARIVQAFPGTTDTMRAELGLTIPDADPTPIPPPAHAPEIDVVSAVMRTVRLRLLDAEAIDRRGKPAGVAGALVFSFVGTLPPPPEETDRWTLEANTTRTTLEVQFPADVPNGSTAWFTAHWYNPRGEAGPMSPPISAQIPGTIQQAA